MLILTFLLTHFLNLMSSGELDRAACNIEFEVPRMIRCHSDIYKIFSSTHASVITIAVEIFGGVARMRTPSNTVLCEEPWMWLVVL